MIIPKSPPKDLQEAAIDLAQKLGKPDDVELIIEALNAERTRVEAEVEHWRSAWRVASFGSDAAAYTADLTRQYALDIIGINSAFVDDDLRTLASLADLAVQNGLTGGLSQTQRDAIEKLERQRRQPPST